MSCTDGTWACWLYDWQTLIAALVAGAAAILVLKIQLSSESRRRKAELDDARKLLSYEIKELALKAWVCFTLIFENSGPSYTVEQFLWDSFLPKPSAFSALVAKLGSLGDYTDRTVAFFMQIDLIEARRAATITQAKQGHGAIGLADSAKLCQLLLMSARVGTTLAHDLNPLLDVASFQGMLDQSSKQWNNSAAARGLAV